MNIKYLFGVLIIVGVLIGLALWSSKVEEKNWTENYDMNQTLRIFGTEETIGNRIIEERTKIEELGYQQVCIVGLEITKGIMIEPRSEDEETFLEIMDHLCREYR